METFVLFFVHLLVAALIFALLYWLGGLVAGLFPPPIAQRVRVILLIILTLFAIFFLLGEVGIWGDWGWYSNYHHRTRPV